MRLQLLEIVRTARLISRKVPAFDAQFQAPGSRGLKSLLSAARQFAERAEPVADLFIRHAMPPSFVDDLKTNIEKIETVSINLSVSRTSHRNATAAMERAFRKGMSALVDLDIVMSNQLRDHGPQLRLWKSARHVERSRRRKAAAAVQGQSA